MPGKGNVYHEKANIWLNILYYLVVIFLIAVIVLMYRKWQGRQAEYNRLVKETAAQEQSLQIELRKTADDAEGEAANEAVNDGADETDEPTVD